MKSIEEIQAELNLLQNEVKGLLPRCISVKELAEWLGVSRTTILNYVDEGLISAFRTKRRILIPIKGVLEWLETCKQETKF